MARKAWDKKSVVLAALRKVSYQSPMSAECMRRAKVAYGRYRCPECEDTFPPTGMRRDHIEPVVPVSGWDSWDGVIDRMLCAVEGWQAICRQCHQKKTNIENKARRQGKVKSGT